MSGRQTTWARRTRSGRSPTIATSVMPRPRSLDRRAARSRRRPASLADHGADQLQDAVGVVGVALLAGERGEPVQRHRRPSSWPTAWRCRSCPSGGRPAPRRPRRSCTGRRSSDPRTSRASCRPSPRAASIQRACPVASASRVNASTSAAWSAASASWRAGGVAVGLPARGASGRRPSRSSRSRNSPLATAACEPVRCARTSAAASASAAQEQRVPLGEHLVVEPGRGRCSRASNRRRRARLDRGRPCAARPRWSSRLGIERPSKLPSVGDAEPLERRVDVVGRRSAERGARPRRASTCGTAPRGRGRASSGESASSAE